MNRKIEIVMAVLLLAVAILASTVILPKTYATQSEPADMYLVAIDAGHGGWDPGKVGSDGTLEKEINLSVAKKLAANLENNGIKAYMLRDEDKAFSDTKMKDLKERCRLIEGSKANITISIHMNSFDNDKAKGAQVFYYGHSVEAERLASILQVKLQELDPNNKRKCKADNEYYMLVHTPNPTVVVECGFLSNPEEKELLLSEEYQSKLSEALAEGIMQYRKSQYR